MRGFRLSRASHESRDGFTLIELLAAIAVLSLILLMLMQISSGMMRATAMSQKQMEATRLGTAALDVLRDDLSHLVRQNGACTVFVKQDGKNSQLAFVTRRRGPQGITDLRFMAVRYFLDGSEIKREVSSVPWNANDLMAGAFQPAASNLSGVLANGVLRFEVVLLLDNGAVVPLATSGSWQSHTWNGDTVPQNFFALQLAGATIDPSHPRVRALAAAVAVVDEKSLLLPKAVNMSAALNSASNDKTPIEVWNTAINQGALASYPRPAAAALRVLQQTIALQ